MTNSQNKNNHADDIDNTGTLAASSEQTVLNEQSNEGHSSHEHEHHDTHRHHSSHGSHKHHKKHSSSKDMMSVVTASGKIKYKKRPKHRSKRHKIKILKRVLLCIVLVLVITSVSLYGAFQYLRNKGKEALLANNKDAEITVSDDVQSSEDGQTIVYNGETYKFNQDLISIVILGVDQSDLEADEYGSAGQTDAVYIFTYDIQSKKCNLLPVSRETMTDVRLYSTSGKEMGLKNMQLCLAYAYGNGKDTSCTNTLASLSRIFYNIPFSTYVALNWDAIGPLNDAIGGVTLTSLEDIKTDYTTIARDQKVTLLGQDAWSYIKYRDISRLDSNSDRLNRQKQYLNAYISKLVPLAREDFSIITTLYDKASEYMYTNVDRNKFIYIASEILPNVYSSKEINFLSIDGETKQGEKYAEFYPNETSLFETILKTFYVKEAN